MNKIMKDINASFAKGELPKGFDYTKDKEEGEIDLSKIQYNAFYKSYGYHESKIPYGLRYLPGIDEIIKTNMERSKTPLEHYNDKFCPDEEIKISDR
jgi:hypothetical protein